jgi:hypothetical protein
VWNWIIDKINMVISLVFFCYLKFFKRNVSGSGSVSVDNYKEGIRSSVHVQWLRLHLLNWRNWVGIFLSVQLMIESDPIFEKLCLKITQAHEYCPKWYIGVYMYIYWNICQCLVTETLFLMGLNSNIFSFTHDNGNRYGFRNMSEKKNNKMMDNVRNSGQGIERLSVSIDRD